MELNNEKSKKVKVTRPEDWKNGSVIEMQWEFRMRSDLRKRVEALVLDIIMWLGLPGASRW